MAQADGVVANGTGSAVRADINGQLAALFTNHSGSTQPSTTFAFQTWADTNTNTLKLRNSSNDGWVQLARLDGQFDAKTFNGNVTLNAQSDLRLADSDSSNWVAFQAPATVASNVTWTLPAADGTSGQTLQTNGSGTLSWSTPSASTDIITEGNTSAEVVDTGSDGHFKVVTEGTEALRVDPSRRLLVGTSSNRTNFALQLEGTSYNQASLSLTNNQNTGNSGYLILGKSRGTALGSNTIVNNGDSLGIIEFTGADGSALQSAALIRAEVDGTPGSGSMPGHLSFRTTPSGSTTPVERMRIDSNGLTKFSSKSGSTSSPDTISMGSSYSSTAGTNTKIRTYDDGSGNYNGIGHSASTFDISAGVSGHQIALYTNSGSGATERGRITSQGYAKFTSNGSYTSTTHQKHEFTGSATNFEVLYLRNTATSDPYGVTINYSGANPNSAASEFLYCTASGLKMSVRSNGGIANYQSNNANLCDEREKKNIESLDSTWNCLKHWDLKKFHYNEDADTDDKRYGVIAQQVAPHCPEVITDWVKQRAEDAVLDEDGNVVTPAQEEIVRMGVKEQQMYWMAIKALQEAQTRIETLETANASLEARLTALEGGA